MYVYVYMYSLKLIIIVIVCYFFAIYFLCHSWQSRQIRDSRQTIQCIANNLFQIRISSTFHEDVEFRQQRSHDMVNAGFTCDAKTPDLKRTENQH